MNGVQIGETFADPLSPAVIGRQAWEFPGMERTEPGSSLTGTEAQVLGHSL